MEKLSRLDLMMRLPSPFNREALVDYLKDLREADEFPERQGLIDKTLKTLRELDALPGD